ncbi:MAG: recombinase family protein [Candidatus Omnitrophica bacterium]|nr:recombinase family protein [Candidatus Omnitrophota bacterium]
MQSRYNVGYLRVSTANQVENGEGLEIQRDKIEAYCKDKNLELNRFYEDKGISGAIKERPGLLRLLKDCEDGLIDNVIVYKQDRLSRELTVSLWLETQFKKHDIEINSVVDPEYNLDDPLQKAFKRIADVFAELEKDVITARLKDGRINNAKNGERGSGPIPFGYVKVGKKLEIKPTEAKNVVRIFRWLVKGHKYTTIVRKLNKLRATTKRGKQFQIQSLKYVLRNKMYYGETSFGNFHVQGTHPPIVSKRLFLKAQKKIGVAF